jgi:hypothetical protein
MFDGFVKNPFSALRCILRHCGVAINTSFSSGFACLETGAFYFAVFLVLVTKVSQLIFAFALTQVERFLSEP